VRDTRRRARRHAEGGAQPFTVTVHISDDHLRTDPAYIFLGYSNTHLRKWDCQAGPPQQLSPTQQEFVFTCPGVAELAAGPYTFSVGSMDLNYNTSVQNVGFEIVDP